MCRDERNQWIDIGGHNIPVLEETGSGADLTQLPTSMESAIEVQGLGQRSNCRGQVWRDSQGSLPKTGLSPYLDDNATELSLCRGLLPAVAL